MGLDERAQPHAFGVRVETIPMTPLCARLLGDDDGQDLIEYALLAGLISVVAVLALMGLGHKLAGSYQKIELRIP